MTEVSHLTGVAKLQERYRILTKLGSGGMADVFLGIQIGEEDFRRLVVIKRIHSLWLENQSALQMFITEARTVAALNHPHIVKIYDLARLGRDICITMEYVNGENLDLLRRYAVKHSCPIPLPIILKLMIEACEALHYAHTATAPDGKPFELVHRDIGPQNLMLDSTGYLKVIDFGIAKSSSRTDLTSPGMIKGKFSYLSPDLFRFEKIDGRADLYALGLVLWELVTLRRSFEFKKDVTVAEVIRRVTTEELPPPSMLTDVPREIDRIIGRAIHKDREARYQSCEELADDLRQIGNEVGSATTKDVETWFHTEFRERIAKRRDFEVRAFEKAKQLLQSGPGEAQMDTDQVPITNVSHFTGMNDYQGLSPVGISKPAHRRSVLFVLLLLGIVGGGAWFFFGNADNQSVEPNAAAPNAVEPKAAPAAPDSEDNLVVRSAPEGAEVFIDGNRVGTTSSTGLRLRISPNERHGIEVAMAGFEPYRTNILGEAFARREVNARLQPVPQPAPIEPSPAEESQRKTSGTASKRTRTKAKSTRSPEPAPPPIVASPPQGAAELPVAAAAHPPPIEAPPPAPPPQETPEGDDGPETSPRPEPKIALAPVFFSGNGNWSGPQVAEQGCGRCHNDKKAPKLDWSQKTRRQWEHFFKRQRHNRFAKLNQHFSAGELDRILAFIFLKIGDEKKSGIAGVK